MNAIEQDPKPSNPGVDTNAALMLVLQTLNSHPRASSAGNMRSFIQIHKMRSFRVSYANIHFPPVVFLESYRHFVPPPAINSTVLPALQNRHPALRHYRVQSASTLRTVFASVAHRAACQACLCLATPWRVPGSERAWSALSPNFEGVVHRSRGL